MHTPSVWLKPSFSFQLVALVMKIAALLVGDHQTPLH
jgi:hypothetical protein